jgi:hypothetical protein
MPTPKKGEKEQDFVSRYMGHPESNKKYPDPKQRAAIAYSVYAEHKKDVAKGQLVIGLNGEISLDR